jgi:LacI family transcriptional regulator
MYGLPDRAKHINKPSMVHVFPIKEIARQSGLGTATVDRVLNNRAHVSAPTRDRVNAAISELSRQRSQLAAQGQRLFVDFVMEAPARFSTEVRRAAESVLPSVGVGVFRPRFWFQETMSDDEMVTNLKRIAKRGTQGICLKARDVSKINDAVDELEKEGIPVVTLATDLPASSRSCYVGINNFAAGKTAAFLMSTALPLGKVTVLANISQDSFTGEAERYQAFKSEFGDLRPDSKIVEFGGSGGLAFAVSETLGSVLQNPGKLNGVYSMGGGNASILAHLPNETVKRLVFVAHDLDAENRMLLSQKKLTYVLHHDLENDMRDVFSAIAGYHRLRPKLEGTLQSALQIITPYNIPVSASRRLAAQSSRGQDHF